MTERERRLQSFGVRRRRITMRNQPWHYYEVNKNPARPRCARNKWVYKLLREVWSPSYGDYEESQESQKITGS